MKYAIILKGKVNLILCTPEAAAERPDVVEVPDDVYTGWIDNGDGTYSPPAVPEKTTVDVGRLLNIMTVPELIALYDLAKTDTRAEILKDFMLAKRVINLARAAVILDYLVTNGVLTPARKDEIIAAAQK